MALATRLFRDIGSVSCTSLLTMSLGDKPPKGIVNPQVFDKPEFKAKWARILGNGGRAGPSAKRARHK